MISGAISARCLSLCSLKSSLTTFYSPNFTLPLIYPCNASNSSSVRTTSRSCSGTTTPICWSVAQERLTPSAPWSGWDTRDRYVPRTEKNVTITKICRWYFWGWILILVSFLSFNFPFFKDVLLLFLSWASRTEKQTRIADLIRDDKYNSEMNWDQVLWNYGNK